MKRYLFILLVIFSYLLLAGCASHRYPYLNKNLASESWMGHIDANPNRWTYGADNWFMTGDPNATEMADRYAPYSAAISTMMVRVPQFVNIQSNGDFQVQIFGTYGANSVYVYGPNDAVRSVAIRVRGNTLCLDQIKKPPLSVRKLIIRIGVNQLNNLIQLGCGPIEGIQLHSSYLSIMSRGRGNIYLAGQLNVRHILAVNAGAVNIFGATTPWLDIRTAGHASVNLVGNVGVRSIVHHGSGDINIIGANSSGLKIFADGRGKIGIRGTVNLQEVKACDNTCVYICDVNSPVVYAWANNNARIGLAGTAENVYVNTAKGSRFEGRNLCTVNAFVRAHDWSHINIVATNRIFAAATENASVYIIGSPNIISQFIGGYGVVIPIWTNNNTMCPVMNMQPYSYKGENISEPRVYHKPRMHVQAPVRVFKAPMSSPEIRVHHKEPAREHVFVPVHQQKPHMQQHKKVNGQG